MHLHRSIVKPLLQLVTNDGFTTLYKVTVFLYRYIITQVELAAVVIHI